MIRQLLGDCRVTLQTLEPGSVQSVVTSPPYYGLRDYGLPPLVWGGDVNHAHDFVMEARYFENRKAAAVAAGIERKGELGGVTPGVRVGAWKYGFCACGAWLGSLGLEPSPDLYVEHLVEVFRHVWRVLRPDGLVWLNLGDSYAGSGNGTNDHRADGSAISLATRAARPSGGLTGGKTTVDVSLGGRRANGYKAKDLMLMPFRVAMALQADGWWLRSVIPWLKRNAMPESVTDRPATSIEYVFLLAKSARYFWDADAVRIDAKYAGKVVTLGEKSLSRGQATGAGINASGNGLAASVVVSAGRNRRNGDWFFESWQGLLLDEQDDPIALVVNPAPFKQSHFATFPPKLVEPMVKASTRPGDVVLDPFGGAGTVGLVADRLGRNAILCDLKPDYAAMAETRIVGDAPLFAEVDGSGSANGHTREVVDHAALTPRNDGNRWNQNNGRGF